MKIWLALLSFCLVAGPFHAQNIFDEESSEAEPQPAEKPAKKKPAAEESDDEEKPVVKVKKKRRARKKKKAPRETVASTPEYSPESVARSTYAWAPEAEDLALTSTAPGLRPENPKEFAKARPAVTEAPQEVRPPSQGFKLPQIPLVQVLIVAGFVILFLIYRFRVGRQIKRKRY